MITFLSLLFILSVFSAVILLLMTILRRILRKSDKPLRKVYLSLFGVGIASFFLIMILEEPYSGWLFMGYLLVPAAAVLLIFSLVRSIRHKKPRKIWIATGITFVLCIGSFFLSDFADRQNRIAQESYEIEIQIDPDFEIADGDAPIAVQTSEGFSDSSVEWNRKVYDLQDLKLILDKDDANAEDCRQAIQENNEIGEEYKAYFLDFVDRMEREYPDLNLSILYHNLKTLKVIALPEREYYTKSLALNSYGCYMIAENTIYLIEGNHFTEGEWGFQVLLHEFCHAARSCRFTEDEINYCITFDSGSNILLEEAMNSVFSCSLLNYEERDIAYQVPSNYLRIMLECMDNYRISDYIDHSDAYFLSELDKCTGYTNYAQVIWKLITLQRADCFDDKIDLPSEKYEPIYTYLCDLYFDRYIKKEMSAEEMTAVVDELVDKAFYDAPEGYKTEPEFFYTYLEEYLEKQAERAA